MAKGDALPKTLLSLEQFAAIEAWFEAHMRMIVKENSAGPGRAERITDAYRTRARAMHLMTGAKMPPNATPEPVAPAAEDDFDDFDDIA